MVESYYIGRISSSFYFLHPLFLHSSSQKALKQFHRKRSTFTIYNHPYRFSMSQFAFIWSLLTNAS